MKARARRIPGALLKRKGEPLKTGKDLEGKVVGMNALRDVQWMLTARRRAGAGGAPTQRVPVPGAAAVAAPPGRM